MFRYLPRIMHCFCITLLINFITMKNLIANVLNEVTLKFYCSVVNKMVVYLIWLLHMVSEM